MPHKDPDAQREYQRKYHREYYHRYRLAHPEQYAESKKRYLAANRERINATARERRSWRTEAQKEQARDVARRWQKEHSTPERRKRYKLSNRGITPEQYDALVARQGGVCAICQSGFGKKPCLDHSHSTEKVRGVLCNNCNAAIGMLRDDPSLLRAAATYLERHVT